MPRSLNFCAAMAPRESGLRKMYARREGPVFVQAELISRYGGRFSQSVDGRRKSGNTGER
jgi:hypothetical protein